MVSLDSEVAGLLVWQFLGFLMLRICNVFFMLLLIPNLAQAQSLWGSGSGFSKPSANDTAARIQRMDMQQKLDNGYYDGLGTSTTTVLNDYSVGEVVVTMADGASSAVDIRSGPDSGTSSYTVGAVNTTTVTSSGSGNQTTVDTLADSTGCQDGSIMMMVPTAGSALNIADGESFMNSVSAGTIADSDAGCSE